MKKIIINLPGKRRLEFKIIKNRFANEEKPLFPKPREILRIRYGSKFSRVFRHVFENKKIQKFLGLNLAALFLSTSLMQFPFEEQSTTEENFVTKAPFVLETKKGIQYPTQNRLINQGYKLFHPGLDIDGNIGDPIRPVMDGTVEAVNYSKYAYGNAILINHGSDIQTLYAHLSKILVKPSQEVTTDTIIGEVGSTGHSTGPHLHLEIRDGGVPFNPLTILPKS
jgi:murein DD-endopeptidase MepM/ murein hydrolase activator NlpD